MTNRLATHYRLSTHLSMRSDLRLRSLIGSPNFDQGWGQHTTIEVDGTQVFVKMIPLTKTELENAYSTKNHYRIPVWYNYGVGSAGFNVFRELAAHQKTTNWVREGLTTSFPLLHHHRILRIEQPNSNIPDLESYIAGWNGSKSLHRYISDRHQAQHCLVLFLEHLTPAIGWMMENPNKLETMFKQAIKAADFLYRRDVIHFDAHVYNWLTDGKSLMLSDFGLVLDQEFELNDREREFFTTHRHYDFAQIVSTIGDTAILSYFQQDPETQKTIDAKIGCSLDTLHEFLYRLTTNAIHLQELNLLKLPAQHLRLLSHHKVVIDLVRKLFYELTIGKKSTNLYPARQLRKELKRLSIIT